MESCCDICGDIGVKEAIITCSQCKSNTEHMYCMRTLIEEHLDDWSCEECESSSKRMSLASSLTKELPSLSKLAHSVEVRNGAALHAESRNLLNESRKVSIDWEKQVASGKTKYICAKEGIILSSGAMNSLSPSKVTSHSSLPQPKIGVNKSQRSHIWPSSQPINFSSQHDLDSGPSRQLKTQRLGNMEISDGQQQQSKKLTGGNGCTPAELRTFNAENVNRNLLSDLEKHSYAPSLSASWKGSFSIHGLKHGELILQIQAHSPSRFRRKAYEFSKKMPQVLQFELVPCKTFWIYFFQENFPDRRDIGLYFFLSDRERSEDYVSLLESISMKSLALRKQIDDVELLIFTSKLLPVDCQRWEGKNFLWGVFHHLKRYPTACLDNRGDSSCQCNAQMIEKDNDEIVARDASFAYRAPPQDERRSQVEGLYQSNKKIKQVMTRSNMRYSTFSGKADYKRPYYSQILLELM
ncbi:hypothetical protein Pfo_020581 [Paulownia fortunei]|nr:hypothetical protein Pfo_020581 [Paulownia fortunei]